jgi:cytochrome P450
MMLGVMNFLSEDMRRNPYPMYDQIRDASPVIYDARSDLWMIFDYEGVKRALTDDGAFSSDLAATANQPTPPWMIFFDPPRHTKLRALIMRAFTPRIVANLEPRIRELSRELLEPTMERGAMDFAADFAIPLPLMVIAEMIGIPSADWPRFRRWSDVTLTLSLTVSSRELGAGAGKDFRTITVEMAQYLAELTARRRVAPKDDLLTKLIEAEVDGERLKPEEVLAFVQLLLVAGNETTTNLLNNALLCLMENPDQLARLRAAPGLLPSAIEEVLRFRSPLQFMFRGMRRDVEMHGHVIPAGKRVLAMIGSANRDPRQFIEPGRFDLTREPNPHIAFGHGIHFCLGAPLSRLEARIALAEFLDRVKSFERASEEPWQPRAALHVLGPERLPIRFEPVRKAAVR